MMDSDSFEVTNRQISNCRHEVPSSIGMSLQEFPPITTWSTPPLYNSNAPIDNTCLTDDHTYANMTKNRLFNNQLETTYKPEEFEEQNESKSSEHMTSLYHQHSTYETQIGVSDLDSKFNAVAKSLHELSSKL